ncbi:hypothetical protein ACFL1U_01690 [Patescibacteria group bacterium]
MPSKKQNKKVDDIKTKTTNLKSTKKSDIETHHRHASEIIGWLGAALAVVSVGFVAYILIAGNTNIFTGDRVSAEQVVSNFHTLVLKSEEVNQAATSIAKVDDTSELQGIVFDTLQEAKDQTFSLSDKKAKSSDQEIVNGYYKFIAAYVQYLDELNSLLEQLGTAPERSFDQANNFGDTALTSITDFYIIAGAAISERIPEEVFVLSTDLGELQSDYQAGLAAAEKEQQELEQAQRQAEEDQAEVEVHVTSFMDAYIAGIEAQVRRYVTDAFEAEFDFNVLTDSYRHYSGPTNFRITDVKRNSESKFTIEGNVAYESKTTDNQWTVAIVLTVVYDADYTLWLIDDTEKLAGGSY